LSQISLASEYAGVGWLIMPTDLGAASERKGKAAQTQAQTEIDAFEKL
jgi:hypothetical protein